MTAACSGANATLFFDLCILRSTSTHGNVRNVNAARSNTNFVQLIPDTQRQRALAAGVGLYDLLTATSLPVAERKQRRQTPVCVGLRHKRQHR